MSKRRDVQREVGRPSRIIRRACEELGPIGDKFAAAVAAKDPDAIQEMIIEFDAAVRDLGKVGRIMRDIRNDLQAKQESAGS